MKIRKTIAAGVAAVAMTFAGTTVAVAEEAPAPAPVQQPETPEEPETPETPETPKEESSSSDIDPDDIKAWIGVVTAAVTALGAIFALVSKYFPFNN